MVEFGESVHFRPVGENNATGGGDQRMLRGVFVGHHERSGAAIFLTPDGVKRGTRIARILEHERWDRVFSATQRNLARPKVPEAEADQGVALVIVMPAAPRTDRRRHVTKRDLVKYGYTDEMPSIHAVAVRHAQCEGSSRRKMPRSHWRAQVFWRVVERRV